MTDEEKDWQTNHGNFIEAFLLFLNKQTDQFVLKGGTALSLCYGLDRFSEDIDLDGRKQDIKEIVKRLSLIHIYGKGSRRKNSGSSCPRLRLATRFAPACLPG